MTREPPAAALGRLVGCPSRFTENWEREPLLSRALGEFDDVLSPQILEDAIMYRGLRTPFVRMLRAGSAVKEEAYSMAVGQGPGGVTGMIDSVGVRRCLSEGATLVAQGLQWYLPSVAAFCTVLSGELGHQINANAYLTPSRSRGGGIHYDYHSVFIRQIWGRKMWRVQEPAEPLPSTPCSVGARVNTPVVLEEWLEAGDCLYLPRGYIHDGWTEKSPSLHLTCSMRDPVTWASIIVDVLRDRAMSRYQELRSIPDLRFADDPAAMLAEASRQTERLQAVLKEIMPQEVADAAIRRAGPEGWSPWLQRDIQGVLDVLDRRDVANLPDSC